MAHNGPMLRFLCCVSLNFFLATWAFGQTSGPCRDQKVNYGSAPAFIQKRINLTRVDGSAKVPASENRVYSPQGNRWFINASPDYSKSGPRSTTLYIGNRAGGVGALQATFTDDDKDFAVSWINDKLLFIQVWWGRIASSDLILDVDKGIFLYDEFAHYGVLVEPCR
jgi:hypothetical protein